MRCGEEGVRERGSEGREREEGAREKLVPVCLRHRNTDTQTEGERERARERERKRERGRARERERGRDLPASSWVWCRCASVYPVSVKVLGAFLNSKYLKNSGSTPEVFLYQ